MSELEQIKKAESRGSNVTVLAIDDEADFLEFVGEAMSSENVDFLSTTDPEEGLTIVQKRHPVWSKISNALKRLGFQSHNFLTQLLSETSRACTIRARRSTLGRALE